MKEATGELSMVVVTIIAIVAILVIWGLVKTPLTNWVGQKFGGMMKTGEATETDTTKSFNEGYDAGHGSGTSGTGTSGTGTSGTGTSGTGTSGTGTVVDGG